MPETTPLIKAALNLRVGAGFDVYGVPQGRWQYEDTVSMGSDDTMGSDDSGKAGRITGAGDAAESDIATESDNAGGNGRYGIWEDTGWISHRD